ncbi:Putative auto-transporter adhesin, head GIN domain [Chryseobacterium arachidis]|uniref:Putative auto-transporter adhesin, head GIN domain n=1 Tax=Chryseobacterium arachidis TaxID=1416778 RepID=A0A1M5CS89_9FLAO|nr:head GIN domain-containing protein [Chryseobacterium arachidis]SHF57635.1 Putative auto-transporter adhesin, head GIN domain [Chryseobacterium arachidis]
MKSQTIFILSAFAFLASCEGKHDNKSKNNWVDKVVNKDSGPIRQKEVAGDFDKIEVSQAIKAEVIKSDVEKVVISAPESIIDEILVDNSGGSLHIHYKQGIRVMNNHNVSAKIYTRDFTKLNANSAASITVKDKFIQDKTDIEVSSAASITGDLEANDMDINVGSSSSFSGKIWAVDLDIEASSAGSISVSGKAKNADISSSSGSSISADGLIADHLKAEASSGASVDIGATSSIQAEASSGGSVNVKKRGNVTSVSKEESSGGSVNID